MMYIIPLTLILCSATLSGLILGFFTLSVDDLKRKYELGDKRAGKIYSLRKRGNLLLTVLIIGNTAINASLSVYLSSIVGGIIGVIVSTVLIVVLGQLIPQSIFARHALKLIPKFIWLIRILKLLIYPLAWPIAYILDKGLGAELPTIYSKRELAKIIDSQINVPGGEVDPEESKIIKGGLFLKNKYVRNIMTHKSDMVLLNGEDALNFDKINEIQKLGHSRLPVYQDDKNNIVGILYVKDLLAENLRAKTVGEAARNRVIFVDPNEKLDGLFHSFKKTKNHLHIVVDREERIRGLVTIEDVLEEIIGDEIFDEFDKKVETNKKIAKNKKRG